MNLTLMKERGRTTRLVVPGTTVGTMMTIRRMREGGIKRCATVITGTMISTIGGMMTSMVVWIRGMVASNTSIVAFATGREPLPV